MSGEQELSEMCIEISLIANRHNLPISFHLIHFVLIEIVEDQMLMNKRRIRLSGGCSGGQLA